MSEQVYSVKGTSGLGDGDFDAAIAQDSVLEITIRGIWDCAQVDRFFAATEPMRLAVRAAHGRVLSLIKVELVQPPLVALHVRKHAIAVKHQQDRNAFVVTSLLSKLQIERLASNHQFGLFRDAPAARAWLLAR